MSGAAAVRRSSLLVTLGLALSCWASPVRAADPTELTVVTPPEIQGAAQVGQVLRGVPATFDPVPDFVICRWALPTLAPGAGGSDGGDLTITRGMLGASFTYVCEARKRGLPGAQTAISSSPVEPGVQEDSFVTARAVVGVGAVGSRLDVGYALHPPEPDLFGTTQVGWRRDGVEISGASNFSYVASDADRGHVVSAVLTVRLDGYEDRTFPLGRVTIDRSRLLRADGPVRVAGVGRVGQRLTATTPHVRPAGEVTSAPFATRLEWQRDGRTIGTGAAYVLRAADAGHRITARLVATGAAYEALVVTGPATTVAKLTPALRLALEPRRAHQVRLTLLASASGLPVTGPVTVTRGAKVVARSTIRNGRLVLILARQRPGRATYVVTYGGSDGVAAGSISRTVRVR